MTTLKPTYYALWAVLIFISTLCKAQNTEPFSFNADLKPSVENFKMTQYGTVAPSLYSGSMTYSIPLCEYKDEDFVIPLKINYNFNGFKPSEHSGIIGLGWALDCGGTISREVRGIPDEVGEDDNDGMNRGYYYTIKDGIFRAESGQYIVLSEKIRALYKYAEQPQAVSNINVFSDKPAFEYFSGVGTSGGLRYDTNPDLFHFSFLGYSGDFMLCQDGTVQVFNTSVPKGEISVSYDFEKKESLLEPEIKITTGNGYVYTFGGDFHALEYSVSGNDTSGPSVTVTSWKMKRIDAPNGSFLTFNFDERHQCDVSVRKSYTPEILTNIPDQFISYQTSRSVNTVCYSYYPLLTGITVDGIQTVCLDYDNNKESENKDSSFVSQVNIDGGSNAFIYDGTSKNLKRIIVNNHDDEEIDNICFTKEWYGNADFGSPKMFLSSVNGLTFGKFVFNYYIDVDTDLPYNDSQSVDHWGFWNGRTYAGALTSHISNSNLGSGSLYSQFDTTFVGRDPNFDNAITGALTSITYPTGGVSTIDYERNTAGKIINRHIGLNAEIDSNNIGFIPGGVRVKKITNSTDGMSNFIEYKYTESYDSNVSSGILLQMPRYAMKADYTYTARDGETAITVDVNARAKAFTDECEFGSSRDPFMTYSRIYEVHPDSSYNEYSFYCYLDMPDVYAIRDTSITRLSKNYNSTEVRITASDETYASALGLFMLPPIMDYSNMRGILKNKKEYDKNGTLMMSMTDLYSAHSYAEATLYLNTIFDYSKIRWRYWYPQLSSVDEKRYEHGRELQVNTNYSYNGSGQMSRKAVFAGNEGEISEYRYCHESGIGMNNPALRSSLYKSVKMKSVIGSTYIISGSSFSYDTSIRNPNPTRILFYSGSIPFKISDQTDIFAIPSSFNTRIDSFSYDPSKFRITGASYPKGAYVSYTWDSGMRHIVTKTVNSPSNTTSFEWIDGIGLSRMVLPSMQSFRYEYDGSNRLSGIKDQNGEYISKYYYHLENE
jgi:hypothetical protein